MDGLYVSGEHDFLNPCPANATAAARRARRWALWARIAEHRINHSDPMMRIGGIGSVAIEEPEKTAPLAPRPIEEPDHAPRPANDTDAPRAPIDTAPHPAGSLDAC